jgi:hypothetical protein
LEDLTEIPKMQNARVRESECFWSVAAASFVSHDRNMMVDMVLSQANFCSLWSFTENWKIATSQVNVPMNEFCWFFCCARLVSTIVLCVCMTENDG